MITCKNYFFLLFFIVACKGKTDTSIVESKKYFDLNEYFLQQAKSLSDATTSLKKQIIKDGKNEQKIFDKPDWQKELKPFSDCDINKPAWAISYFTDTTYEQGTMQVSYVAKDLSLPMQQVVLDFENNKLLRIKIHKQSSNSYYRSKNDYIFVPDSGYTITGSQEVMLANKTNYLIIAKWLPSIQN